MFSLAATRGFMVTAEQVEGEIRFVHIESMFDGPCRIANPWEGEAVRLTSQKQEVVYQVEQNVLYFTAGANETYLLTRAEAPLDNYYKETFMAQPNQQPKTWNDKIIGQYSLTKGRTKQSR